MAVQARHTDVTATVTLWVTREAGGDLQQSVETVLRDVAGVDAVTIRDVTDVQPRATDIQVTAVVDVAVAAPADDEQVVRKTLADGFGVMGVDRVETAA
ncbi:hypothetical protein [Halapricum desulfuricans]|uniref:Uncharacterized protein n=1 Tax=Halapricum desulfuricans TaxID=2841257 RepID=A0A897NPJ6_9EURY|nr:hypothetical protein [Halapricum desulfuricans]QSG14678.1 Uncharacterized protein HSEST_1145 [Halapricum desulfuricans]